MAISKALKAVNDTMDWTVLFIVLFVSNGSEGSGLPLSCFVINLFYIHYLSATSNSPIVWVQMSMYGIVLTILMFSMASLPPKANSREYPKHSS